jgi:hypothetical protein
MLRFAAGDSPVWMGEMLVAVGGRAKERMEGRDFSARALNAASIKSRFLLSGRAKRANTRFKLLAWSAD